MNLHLYPDWFGGAESKAALPAPSNYGTPWQPPLDWIARAGKRRSDVDLINLFRDTAFYCANLNARGVARTPLLLYRKRAAGQRQGEATRKASRDVVARLKAAGYAADDEIEEVVDHPFLDLMDKPFLEDGVAMMGCFTFKEISQLYLETIGRMYWLIDATDDGTPRQLFPLIANSVEAWKAINSPRFVDEYRYHVGMGVKTFKPAEIVPFLCPSLTNPYTGGLGPMAAAADRVGLVFSYLSQNQSLLNNRARPDMVIAPSSKEGAVVSKPTISRMRKWFRPAFGGVNQGKPMIVSEPIEIHHLSFSPKDMGELADEEQAINQTARIFDVPLSMINRDANRASAEEGRKQHAYDALTPRLRRLEHSINAHILPRYGDPRLFCASDEPYKEPLSPDPAQVGALVTAGVFHRDEAREMFGWGPMAAEYVKEQDDRRKEEMEANKPKPFAKPTDKMSASERQQFHLARRAIRSNKAISLNGCNH